MGTNATLFASIRLCAAAVRWSICHKTNKTLLCDVSILVVLQRYLPALSLTKDNMVMRCSVGQRLAVLEAIQILSGIMKSFTVELANVTSATVGQNASITLRPVDLRLKLTKRRT
eukprot:m.419137 g.419137  ORF g.419137 m.419137 type:complete len:115 (+) comp21300_c0_seq3:241-585(+)